MQYWRAVPERPGLRGGRSDSMGDAGNVKPLWQLREAASINPGFVRSIVALNLEQMRAGLQMHLKQTENQTPERQEFIHGLLGSLPEAQTILTGAMELAVLGRHCCETLPMDATAERYNLPKDPVELRRRIDRVQQSVLVQFEMLSLPEVAEDVRAGVRATYGEDFFRSIAGLICAAAAENLGFAGGRSSGPPLR